ncbi:hypothetical protein J6590_095976 [Homalodisca vitripennis]|nr:hypothetical protein J6590_095976 [Homalodisca vitripennis]
MPQLTAGKTCPVYQLSRRHVAVWRQDVEADCGKDVSCVSVITTTCERLGTGRRRLLVSKEGNGLLISQLTAGKTCPVYQLTRRYLPSAECGKDVSGVSVDTATCDRLETGRRRLLESKEGNVLLISQLNAGKTYPVYQLTRRHVTV